LPVFLLLLGMLDTGLVCLGGKEKFRRWLRFMAWVAGILDRRLGVT
jgi:hypothetical protein